MKGGEGFLDRTCLVTALMSMAGADCSASTTWRAACSSGISLGTTTLAVKVSPVVVVSCASTVQYSRDWKASISSWRMQMSLRATDCTLPPERPRLTFFQSSGLMVYPTIRSMDRLAIWAS